MYRGRRPTRVTTGNIHIKERKGTFSERSFLEIALYDFRSLQFGEGGLVCRCVTCLVTTETRSVNGRLMSRVFWNVWRSHLHSSTLDHTFKVEDWFTWKRDTTDENSKSKGTKCRGRPNPFLGRGRKEDKIRSGTEPSTTRGSLPSRHTGGIHRRTHPMWRVTGEGRTETENGGTSGYWWPGFRGPSTETGYTFRRGSFEDDTVGPSSVRTWMWTWSRPGLQSSGSEDKDAPWNQRTRDRNVPVGFTGNSRREHRKREQTSTKDPT